MSLTSSFTGPFRPDRTPEEAAGVRSGFPLRRRIRIGLATLFLLSGTVGSLGQNPTPPEILRDFDQDGRMDRLVRRPTATVIQSRQTDTDTWMDADFQLPEGIFATDEQGADTGLRFVDLNGDGFDDLLLSNDDRVAVHLWTKNVQPHLGWTKGWTQFVRDGPRSGSPNEPISLVGAEVSVSDRDLLVRHPGPGTRSEIITRIPLQSLIAFDASAPLSPEEALKSFRLRPGFRIELVAAEPVVMDPIYFDWSADGRLWVVEMGDYPAGMDGRGKPGGVVKRLEDTDGDGRFDQATTFLESLAFPTSLMPWRDGLLIAAAPDIIFAADTDGDGRADHREVLLTGFTPGNQQHRVNGFELGLDGWVHAANGDSGGRVRSVKTGAIVDIRGRDFRFRPDTGELETLSAETQYGRRRDDWGNWFGNNNPTWLWHVTLPEHYLRRNPKLAVRSVRQVLANYDDSTRVFPISPALVRPNQPWSLNHVTSACSPTPYRDSLFGPGFEGSVFISEPVHNAIHREVLQPAGATFLSHRAAGEEQSEFLASTDNWFRPITTRFGPDGALYLADMYRLSIEHPEWISPEMQARIDVRAGTDRGRLYRIVPEGTPLRPIPNLARLKDRELALAMNSPSGWQRDTVQRLLMERRPPGVAAELQRLLDLAHAPQVRLQALATLGVLGLLGPEQVLKTLADPHPAVRCEALRQSERWGGQPGAIFDAIARLTEDSEATVRFQVAFTLGEWPFTQTRAALERLAADAGSEELLRIAVMSSLPSDSDLFRQLNDHKAPAATAAPLVALKPSSADRAQVIAGYGEVAQLEADASRGRELFEFLCATCHRLRGAGHEVGPDLDMVATKSADWLVTAILDPTQAIEVRYRAWSITLRSGEELSGIITSESANNLVLRVAGGLELPVLRADIKSITPQSTSLMPSGFESALPPQGMADLLAWLRGE
jgi:putative membrane-bound dehydrogenase-like protein